MYDTWLSTSIFIHRPTDYLSQAMKQKGGDLTQSYDKSPYANRNVKREKWQHKQRHKKVRLNSNCGPT